MPQIWIGCFCFPNCISYDLGSVNVPFSEEEHQTWLTELSLSTKKVPQCRFMFHEKCAPSSVTFTYCSFRGFGIKQKTPFFFFSLKNIKVEVAQIMLHTSLHFHKGGGWNWNK